MKRTKMASLSALFCTCIIVFVVTTSTAMVEAEHEFKVGDDWGWQLPSANNTAVYAEWAARNRFQVGDSLSFEYKNDSVLEVEKWDYYHCNTSQPIIAFNNGKSVIKLDRPGPFYFISGALDHCKNGQQLLTEVMSPHSSPPWIANPPEPYLDMAPSPSRSSGVTVSAVVGSVCMIFMAAFATLVFSAS